MILFSLLAAVFCNYLDHLQRKNMQLFTIDKELLYLISMLLK